MATLSDAENEQCVRDSSLVITPFDAGCLSGAGYDLRLSQEVLMQPGESKLVATLERIEVSEDLIGTLHIRSTLARSGMIASLALVDPGFRGQLTILLFNGGRGSFSLARHEKFVQVVFHRLGLRTSRPYAGKYQDSQGIVDSRP